MGENSFAPLPTAVYGLSLLTPAIAFTLLVISILRVPGQSPALADALGRDLKGKASIAIYALGIPVALLAPIVAVAMFVGVALLWIVPDPRFERVVTAERS